MDRNILHSIVWNRFISKQYGHILSYVDENGYAAIPTPEECNSNNPNAYGYGTPLEDGAFYSGLYAGALFREYNKTHDAETAKCLETLINALLRLQDVSTADGFIARGVATDGISHYSGSSEDQVFPWIMAMYDYYNSDLCKDKEDIKGRLLREIEGVWPKDYRKPMFHTTDCAERGDHETTDWRGICSMMYCARLRAELTQDPDDLAHYEFLRDTKPAESPFYTRGEMLANSVASTMTRRYKYVITPYIVISFHMALMQLAEWDETMTQQYKNACAQNGIIGLSYAEDLLKYDNQHGYNNVDWRLMKLAWKPFNGDRSTIRALVREEAAMFGRSRDHANVEGEAMDAICGIWIALTCGDEKTKALACEAIDLYFDKIDWDTFMMPVPFAAECCMIFADK